MSLFAKIVKEVCHESKNPVNDLAAKIKPVQQVLESSCMVWRDGNTPRIV